VPFLFTVKNLAAKGDAGQFLGQFDVPSYRGATFLDPKRPMMFKASKKDKPSSLLKHCRQGVQSFLKHVGNTSKQEKAIAEVSGSIMGMKSVLYGDGKTEPSPEAGEELLAEVFQGDLLGLLFANLRAIEFEARKDFVIVFGNLMRREVGSKKPGVEFLEKNNKLLDDLVLGYEDSEVAVICGQLLRVCIDNESLARIILHSGHFPKFFVFVENAGFDVASDAFLTFKDLLTKHKTLCAEFLEKNYETIFEEYTKLLHSKNYVTRRQSLKLLGELLLDRANFNVMTKYISNQQNLKLMMNLLRDKNKTIQFEAFHVFKVFVANPNKAKPILDILIKNKEKLITFLSNFHNEKEDEQFADEKAFLLKQIEQLPSASHPRE